MVASGIRKEFLGTNWTSKYPDQEVAKSLGLQQNNCIVII